MLTTPQSADVFVASLHEEERYLLQEALRIHDQEIKNIGKGEVESWTFYIFTLYTTVKALVSGHPRDKNLSIIEVFC